tara:strand:+ start:460 stop:801 length:342 start_codon:yes stop_codon:yes gene_type:complete
MPAQKNILILILSISNSLSYPAINPILVEKSLTAIDSSIIPKTFLTIPIPFFPRIFSILFEDLRTIYTKIELINIAAIILVTSNSALRDNNVVRVPAPAITGKAIGTIDAVSG